MTTTVHNDEIGGRLAEALMLLEMAHESSPVDAVELLAAAHDIVQSVRGTYTGNPVPVSAETAALLARIHADAAIENAQAH